MTYALYHILNALVAMTIGTVVYPAAIVTGQQERLCSAIGGHYTPTAPPGNACPDGEWIKLIPIIADIRPRQ
jgi:hypothetical protein